MAKHSSLHKYELFVKDKSKGRGKVDPGYAVKAQSGRRGMAPVILNLSTSWRSVVVNITPSALSPQGKNPGMH